MLVVGLNLDGSNLSNLDSAATSEKPYLLVCEIPPDKRITQGSSKSGKSDEEKPKIKPVSYSSQLSFESEDEFYEPLFSSPVPHGVFDKIGSPTKDAFPKMWEGKSGENGTTKDAKIVQCLSLHTFAKSNGFFVAKVLPYDDGAHVLVMLAKRKQCGNELGSTALRCSETDEKLRNSDSVSNEASQADDKPEVPEENTESSGTEQKDSSCSKVEVESGTESFGCDQGSSARREVNRGSSAEESCAPNEVSHCKNSHTDPSVPADNGNHLSSTETSGLVSSEKSTAAATTVQTAPPISDSSLASTSLDSDTVHERSSSEVKNLTEEVASSSYNNNRDIGNNERSCCLLLYKTKKTRGRTLLQDEPCKTILFSLTADNLRDVFLLPEDAEESFNPGSVEAGSGKSTYLAGVTDDGSVFVMDGLSLEVLTRLSSSKLDPGECYRRVVFCSGLGSFCACTENGKLHFLHLMKNTSETGESSLLNVKQIPGKEKQPKGNTFGTRYFPTKTDEIKRFYLTSQNFC